MFKCQFLEFYYFRFAHIQVEHCFLHTKSAKERERGRENMNAFCLFVCLFGGFFLMMDAALVPQTSLTQQDHLVFIVSLCASSGAG